MQKRSIESNKYFPGLKRVRQKTDSYCGPAVIEMLASFIGVYVNQNKLVKICGFEKKIKKLGINIRDLAKAVKIMVPEGTFWFKENATAKNLDELVNTYKIPVGIEWQGVFRDSTDKNFPDDGHYSIVTYVNRGENKILISDPFRGFAKVDREFKLDFFKRRWWDTNEVRDPKTKKEMVVKDHHMMFIITPKEVTFPEELGMKRS